MLHSSFYQTCTVSSLQIKLKICTGIDKNVKINSKHVLFTLSVLLVTIHSVEQSVLHR